MTRFIAASAILAMLTMQAWGAQPPGSNFTDSATSEWFKGLTTKNDKGNDIGCCDQSDCRQTTATIGADGIWVAESRLYPGEKVRVPARNVLKQPNPLMNAVLCEAPGGYGPFEVTTTPGGMADFVYCFVAPPQYF